jgi:hypothetical protein
MVARLIQSVGFARELFQIEIDLPKISSSVCRFPLGFLITPCYIGSIWPESIHGTLFLPRPIAAREEKKQVGHARQRTETVWPRASACFDPPAPRDLLLASWIDGSTPGAVK